MEDKSNKFEKLNNKTVSEWINILLLGSAGPIKTPINEENPYQMGRIEPNRMYDIVKKWEWGNSESPEIYHDPETRKNSISFKNIHIHP